jgi:peroxiredoxin
VGTAEAAAMKPAIPLVFAIVLMGGCEDRVAPAEPTVPIGTETGQRAPPLRGRLPAADSFAVDTAAGGPTVLVFYRTIECGLCRVQLEQMQTHIPAYDRAGAQVVAVTLDPPSLSQAWIDQGQLEFPVVSVDSATFRAWGALPAEGGTPLPATYVLDPRGIVRFRHIGRNAADRTSDAEVVAILESLAST